MSAREEAASKALQGHRQRTLTCYDHYDGWCCECGTHEIQVPWTEHVSRAIVRAVDRVQVTTPEELDALPEGSLLLSRSEYRRYAGTVWRVISGRAIEQVGREAQGITPLGYFKDPLPATVLHVGGAE